ncbi:MAG: DUF559 domain-containing protein [Nitrospirae bacterium]|nr:DUF559 domain-containing protein [Nitrospirota bacterium]
MERLIKGVARRLRTELTSAEKLLWERLRYTQVDGFKFRRQQALGRFIADFICFEKRLIIELDGGVHDLQKERDAERDLYLKESGYTVIRIQNREVEQNIDSVLQLISNCLTDGDTPPASGNV